MMMSFEQAVLSILGDSPPEAFRLHKAQRMPSSTCHEYCPYSEMKWFVETVFKAWIRKRIADADYELAVLSSYSDNQEAEEKQPVIDLEADTVDPCERFYREADACRHVFDTWVKEACGIFDIAKPPPAAKPPKRNRHQYYVDAYM